jgi:DNA (cytosine-5)-methyltransferase 1
MLENVPWIVRTRHFNDFKAGLARLGYTFIVDVKDAQHFGVPQRRKRAILMGVAEGSIRFAPPARKQITVREAIGNIEAPRYSRDPLHNRRQHRNDRVRALIRNIPRDGGSRTDLPPSQQLKCHATCDGFKDVYGRMAWDRAAPTITGGCFNPSKGRFLHPSQNRAISLREAAILQGFPRGYRFPITAGVQAVALMIGNALPPEFIRRHALEIKKALASHRP